MEGDTDNDSVPEPETENAPEETPEVSGAEALAERAEEEIEAAYDLATLRDGIQELSTAFNLHLTNDHAHEHSHPEPEYSPQLAILSDTLREMDNEERAP